MEVPSQEGVILDDQSKNDPKYRAIAEYLDVDVNKEWSRQKPKLEFIIGWAQSQSKSEDPGENLKQIRELERKFGHPSWNDRKINHLYRQLRISDLSKSKEKPEKGTVKIVKKSAPPPKVGKEVRAMISTSVEAIMRNVFKQIGSWKDRIK